MAEYCKRNCAYASVILDLFQIREEFEKVSWQHPCWRYRGPGLNSPPPTQAHTPILSPTHVYIPLSMYLYSQDIWVMCKCNDGKVPDALETPYVWCKSKSTCPFDFVTSAATKWNVAAAKNRFCEIIFKHDDKPSPHPDYNFTNGMRSDIMEIFKDAHSASIHQVWTDHPRFMSR